jgi:hypothetical protein
MRRLARHLLTLCTVLSLLLFVAVCALWVRSLRRGDLLDFVGLDLRLVIRSDAGLIVTQVSRAEVQDRPGLRHVSWPIPTNWSIWGVLGRRWWQRLGFGHNVGGTAAGQRVDQFVFPHYCLAAASLPLPALMLIQHRRARRLRIKGLCPNCGYDLRATPQRCPECGSATERADQSAR